MNEKLPYEEKFRDGLEDLPLPSENAAWQKMQELLDKEDGGRRRLPPPIFLRSCAGWGLLLLLVGGLAWWLLTGEQEGSAKAPVPATVERTPGTASSSQASNNPADKEDKGGLVEKDRKVTSKKQNTIQEQGTGTALVPGTTTTQAIQGAEPVKASGSRKGMNTVAAKVTLVPGNSPGKGVVDPKAKASTAKVALQKGKVKRKETKPDATGVEKADPLNANALPRPFATRKDSLLLEIAKPGVIIDSTAVSSRPVPLVDSVAAAPDSVLKKKEKPSKWWLAAGIGLQQMIPVAGQSAVPYNYYGRTGSIYDYIPSVYLRLHRGKQWFLQGEFRYGAPQSVREFSFSRNTRFDTASNNLVVTSVRLKKTYYHQLPLSFNYYLRPQWSVGVGGIYNYFFGAVTEEEVKNRNVANNTESIKTQIQNIRGYKDSFLYKTHVQFLLQTEYEWKRFTLGLRYTRDLQPYIRYTLPDGTLRDEKNQSLQFLLRFRLWKSQ